MAKSRAGSVHPSTLFAWRRAAHPLRSFHVRIPARFPRRRPAASRLGHACDLFPDRDPAHHLLGDAVPASQPGASRSGLPSGARAFLPLLDLAVHLDDHQGVGGDPPQAPRQGRDRRGSAQPADQGHQHRVLARRRAVQGSARRPRLDRAVWQGLPGRLDRASPLHAVRDDGADPVSVHQLRAVRLRRRRAVGDPDGVDSVLGRGRGQRPRPLVGLPQLRKRRHLDQPRRRGACGSAARSCTTTTTPSRRRRSSRCASSSSTSAGPRSACSKRSAWRRCCAWRPRSTCVPTSPCPTAKP